MVSEQQETTEGLGQQPDYIRPAGEAIRPHESEDPYQLTLQKVSPYAAMAVEEFLQLGDSECSPELVDSLAAEFSSAQHLWVKKAIMTALFKLGRQMEIQAQEAGHPLGSLTHYPWERMRFLLAEDRESMQVMQKFNRKPLYRPKAWYARPQRFPGLSIAETSSPQLDLGFDPRLSFPLSSEFLERVRGDVAWIISNQCGIGVSKRDLMHAHILLPAKEGDEWLTPSIKAFEDNNITEVSKKIGRLYDRAPYLGSSRAFDLPGFDECQRLLTELHQLIIDKPADQIVLFYHSLEDASKSNPDHPFCINRNILTFSDSRHVAVPSGIVNTVKPGAIPGLAEIPLLIHMRIGEQGKNDRDLSRLKIVASPYLQDLRQIDEEVSRLLTRQSTKRDA